MTRLIVAVAGLAVLAPAAWAQSGCSAYGGYCGGSGVYQMVPGPRGPWGQSYYVPGGNGPTVYVQQPPQIHYYNNVPIDPMACAQLRRWAGANC